jgi:DNA-binding cell septation regulator SpoVG
VTFPSRPYNKKGTTQFYDLFRPTTRHSRQTITDFVLAEFRREVEKAPPDHNVTG